MLFAIRRVRADVPGSGNNHPLKGGKYSDWEGGVRTNAFIAGVPLRASATGLNNPPPPPPRPLLLPASAPGTGLPPPRIRARTAAHLTPRDLF